MNRASRRGASPDLVGGPWWPLIPEAVREGTRPVKDRAPARDWNLAGSPRRARIWAPLMMPDAGHRSHDAGRVSLLQQAGEFGVQVADLGAQGQCHAGFGGDVLGQVGIAELVVP
jgi:hypothetical protein